MIIQVPLFIQTSQVNSGPTCLKMVLAHFGEHFGIQVLEKRMGMVNDKRANSIQIVAAAASLGYGVTFYSKIVNYNKNNEKLDFYKKYNSLNSSQINVWIEKAKREGAFINEQEIGLDDLLNLVSEDSIPVTLLDFNIIRGREEDEYAGMFVPITGYDSKYVYVNNGGYNDHEANIPIEREIFDKARKAKGTDQDVIVIFRKGIDVKIIRPKIKSENVEEKILRKAGEKPGEKVNIRGQKIEQKINEKIKESEINEEKKAIFEMEKEVEKMKVQIDIMKSKIKNK